MLPALATGFCVSARREQTEVDKHHRSKSMKAALRRMKRIVGEISSNPNFPKSLL
jgi:hypothetical protein